jgi:hypothetical protein
MSSLDIELLLKLHMPVVGGGSELPNVRFHQHSTKFLSKFYSYTTLPYTHKMGCCIIL